MYVNFLEGNGSGPCNYGSSYKRADFRDQYLYIGSRVSWMATAHLSECLASVNYKHATITG